MHTHTRAHTHARTHAQTHTRTRTHAHARTHARTRTRTHSHAYAHTHITGRVGWAYCPCQSLWKRPTCPAAATWAPHADIAAACGRSCGRTWLKALAPWNIPFMSVTLETSHFSSGWLNAAALQNMPAAPRKMRRAACRRATKRQRRCALAARARARTVGKI